MLTPSRRQNPRMKKIVYYILTSIMNRDWLIKLLTNEQEKELLRFRDQGYLFDIGWTNSMLTGNVVDRFNKPLPWVTYPFIEFITPRLNKSMHMFEYGSGNSTLFYSDKVASVVSVEHNMSWFEKVKGELPINAKLFYCELAAGGEYSKFAFSQNEKFDIVVVDGRDRVNCCINGVKALNDQGVLVLDDSEREKYTLGVKFFKDSGFKSVEFWGTAPVINYLKCTTIFYREGNCLGL